MNGNSLYYSIAKKVGVETKELILAVRCLLEMACTYSERKQPYNVKMFFTSVKNRKRNRKR